MTSGAITWRVEAGERHWDLSLGWATRPETALLHPQEEARAAGFPAEARTEGFRLGRTAAKRALGAGAERLVGFGLHGQPVLDVAGELSLSHTKGLALALSAPAGLPVGIDVEHIELSPFALQALEDQTNRAELSRVECVYPDRPRALYGLWSAKEALSKGLRTGLAVPLSFFEVGTARDLPLGRWIEFCHFSQHAALQTEIAGRVVSLLVPKVPGNWIELLERVHREVNAGDAR